MLGGAGGIIMTLWLRGLMLGFQPPLPGPMDLFNFPVDWRVVSFTFGIALVAGLLFGLAPALRSSRTDLVSTLKEGSRGTASSGRRFGLRGALVVLQVAVCVILLVGAALIVRSSQHAADVDLGFDPAGLLTYRVDMDMLDYEAPDASQFFDTATERISALPGVRAVGLASRMPLSFGLNTNGIYIDGRQTSSDDPAIFVDATTVNGGYFEALGLDLLDGRWFGAQDTSDTIDVVVVSAAFERELFPEGAVGQRFYSDGLGGNAFEIVGVVGDTKVRTVGEEPRSYVYYSREQRTRVSGPFAIRLDRDSPELRAAVRTELLAIEPELIFNEDSDMLAVLGASLFPVRFGAGMLIAAGVIALLLVSVGLYGVIAYSVARRAKEIGVRMAMGAHAGNVVGMVVGQGMRVVGIGIGIGLVAAFAATRLLSTMLYGVDPSDPLTLASAVVFLALVALVACTLPALRATRVHPAEALRDA